MPESDESMGFWEGHQPGFRFTSAQPGSERFFHEVEEHRYQLEPHILEMARFREWGGCDVLEVGCGIGTDGAQFAKAGARYTGADASEHALELARQRFRLDRLTGTFQYADATSLPFPDRSFDLVYSHGVLHHIPDTERAVGEIHRVLRDRGTALVMLYHRGSLNYWVTILGVRRLLASVLLAPGLPRLIAKATGERSAVLEGHRRLLRAQGARYLLNTQLFLSNNTDGPWNPLSKVFSREEAMRLFAGFRSVETEVRYLNLRLYPGGGRLERSRLGGTLEKRLGWHLYARAVR